MTDTNELRKLLAAATPTPWAVSHGDESWEVVQTKPDGTPDFGARRTAFDDGSAGGEYGPSCNTLTRDLIEAAITLAMQDAQATAARDAEPAKPISLKAEHVYPRESRYAGD